MIYDRFNPMNQLESHTDEKNLKFFERTLVEQVAFDLKNYFEMYQSLKIGVRQFSAKCGLSEKTIQRILKLENKPTYQTILKIYSQILDVNDPSRLISLLPSIIAKEIQQRSAVSVVEYENSVSEIENKIYNDQVFSDIYLRASCDCVTQDFIAFRFGEHGLEVLKEMLLLQVLKLDSDGRYTLKKHVNLSAKTLKKLSSRLIETYAKSQNAQVQGENLIAFYTEALSEEAYNEWLRIDEEAFYKKIEVSKRQKSRGHIKAFTVMVTDTMTSKS